MPRYRLTLRAKGDILDIADFTIQRWDADQAGRYLQGLEHLLGELARQPRMGRARPELGERVLSFRCESHMIYYIAARPGIVVLRILHGRQDPGRHLR
ncbi:MAG: type II toxin-antitoxin system RelE/ParE family toxin [Alphaproteobacteria bacterium]